MTECWYCKAGIETARAPDGMLLHLRRDEAGKVLANPACWAERQPVWALYFDTDGYGPHGDLIGSATDIRAQVFRFRHDDIPAKVGIISQVVGGLYMLPADARRLAEELIAAADRAEAGA